MAGTSQTKPKENDSQRSDSYEEDEFEQHEEINEDETDKLVDEEIYLNTSIGKKDSDFLKELMKPPTRTKQKTTVVQPAKLDGSGEYSDDIDEFIKRHIDNNEEEDYMKQQEEEYEKEQNKMMENGNGKKEGDEIGQSSSSNEEEEEEEQKKSPKEHLLSELRKLADIFGKYSLTDR